MDRATHLLLDEKKFLSESEQHALRGSVHERKGRSQKRVRWVEWFLIELALESGLRVGEMSALCCGDLRINFERPYVLVRHGKGGKPRRVFVRNRFVKNVRRYLQWKRASNEPTCELAPVFRSLITGKGLTVRALQKAYTRVANAAGVDGHSLHHFRHTYASELYRASGGNIRLVQTQLGHMRVTTTQIYAHVLDDEMDAAVARVYPKT